MDPWYLLEEMAAPVAAFKKELKSQPQTLLALGKDGVTSEPVGGGSGSIWSRQQVCLQKKGFFLIGVSESLSLSFFFFSLVILPSKGKFLTSWFSEFFCTIKN